MTGMLELRREVNVEAKRPFLAGRQPYDNHLVGQRGKDGALVLHTSADVTCSGQGIAKVQLAAVVAYVLMAQLQLHAAQGQETHAVRAGDEVLVHHLMGLFFLTFEDERAHLLQVFASREAVVVMR